MLDNYSYLLLFRGNNGYANAPECYVYTYSAVLLKLRWFWLQEPADEVYEMLDRKRKETLAYKRSFFVRMVSDPKIYNPKIAKTLSRSRHRHVTEAGATVDNGVSIQAPM